MQIEMAVKGKRWWRESTNCWVVEVDVEIVGEIYNNVRTTWPICTRPERSDVIVCIKKAVESAMDEL